MSASAPLGRPSKNTGSVDADCTSATRIGELVSVVISQAAATSFIHTQVLAVTQVIHNMRNAGIVSGAGAVIAPLWPSGAASGASRAATDSSVPWARAAHSAAAAASDEGAGPGGSAVDSGEDAAVRISSLTGAARRGCASGAQRCACWG